MAKTRLFERENTVGIFRGFSESGLEFHADIVLPYRNDFQTIPMHGQFLLVQLANEEEAVLGRITSFYSDGKLTREYGENFSLRVMEEDREIPEDLLERYVKYKVSIRVLGVLRQQGETFVFVASHRRLPHAGSKVAFPSDAVLQQIIGHDREGADLGFFALGEFIYTGNDRRMTIESWMQIKHPDIIARFPIGNLVSRRSFVFARAGFGKSNLIKLLFSELYRESPTKLKRGRPIPVGTIVFDPDGEYFFPDDNGRPGLADVPHLQDKLVVFTHRQAPSDFYRSFVAGGIKLDIRRLPPSSVIGIALSAERQEQQNVRKLRALSGTRWMELVNLVYQHEYGTKLEDVKKLLNIGDGGEAEANAALNNIVYIVRALHDPRSQFLDHLFTSLKAGKLCVIDISGMRGKQGLILSSIVLQQIFNHNQEKFTDKESRTIPTIAVIEEAQSVLGSDTGESAPFVEWFKEGRKYDLGAVMITQQPGSLPLELLSQGDNWFVFHLLSASDLKTLQRANAHFSDDLLGGLLNEPLPGQGVMWSSVGANPYPISFRALSFEKIYPRLDANYDSKQIETFATLSLINGNENVEESGDHASIPDSSPPSDNDNDNDPLMTCMAEAVTQLKAHEKFQNQLVHGKGNIPWGVLAGLVESFLPIQYKNDGKFVHNCVKMALDESFGEDGWDTKMVTSTQGKDIRSVYRKVSN